MTNIEIFNLTQHTINIVDEDNVTILNIEPDCCSPEIEIKISSNGTLGKVPMTKIESTEIIDLPPFKVGIIYIVDPAIVYAAIAEGREISDLLVACESVYDEDGSLIGYRSLSFFKQ